VQRLVAGGVTANHLTLAAIVGSIGVGIAVAIPALQPRILLVLPVWLLLRMALNAMDGMAAREHGMRTRFGGALNEVGDVVSDVALYLPLAAVSPTWPAVVGSRQYVPGTMSHARPHRFRESSSPHREGTGLAFLAHDPALA